MISWVFFGFCRRIDATYAADRYIKMNCFYLFRLHWL